MSATIRDGYKFELGTRLGVHGVGAVGSALVIVFLGAIGGALQLPLACVCERVWNFHFEAFISNVHFLKK